MYSLRIREPDHRKIKTNGTVYFVFIFTCVAQWIWAKASNGFPNTGTAFKWSFRLQHGCVMAVLASLLVYSVGSNSDKNMFSEESIPRRFLFINWIIFSYFFYFWSKLLNCSVDRCTFLARDCLSKQGFVTYPKNNSFSLTKQKYCYLPQNHNT